MIFSKYVLNLIFISVIAFIGCSSSSIIIHKTVLKPKEMRGKVKAVEHLRLVKSDDKIKFEKFYQGVTLRDSIHTGEEKKDTAAVVSFFPDRREFSFRLIPKTDTLYDTVRVNESPIVVRGNSDWEKLIWIIGTLVINIVVFFVGKKLKR